MSIRKRIVITGGAGFIGSHLCERFLGDGWDVVCVDSLLTGSIDNIEPFRSDPRFTFEGRDISDGLYVEGDVHAIVNLASPASPIDYLKLPIETMRAGAFGTWHCLQLARSKGARFMMASTSEVYGDPQEHPQREDYWGHVNPIGPRSVYDEAKRYAEALTAAYRRSLVDETQIIRIFNTYGPRMRIGDGRVVPAFMTKVLAGEPLVIFGDGTQSRSFCYVEDLVEGIVRMLASEHPGPVNLGNPHEFTIGELARLCIELFGDGRSTLTYTELPTDDPKMRKPDISLARQILGWTPEVDLRAGLRRSEGYFRRALSGLAS